MCTLDAHFLREGTCRWVYEWIKGRTVAAGSSGGHALDALYMEVLGSRAERWVGPVQSNPQWDAVGARLRVCVCVLVLMFTLQRARHRSGHTVDKCRCK